MGRAFNPFGNNLEGVQGTPPLKHIKKRGLERDSGKKRACTIAGPLFR
jgi:hypothetical protein